jgi:hypothetical protein
MTTFVTSYISNPVSEDGVEAWKNSGSNPEEAARLMAQENLLKKMSAISGQISPTPSPRMASPRETTSEVLSTAQVVQLPTTLEPIPAPEGIKKGKVQKGKKEFNCCKNGLLIPSHLPIFGVISSNVSRCLLAKKIKNTTDLEKISKLKERLNQYTIASLTSTLLTVALAVAALVVGLLMGGIAFIVGLSAAAAALAFIPLTTYDSIQLHRSLHKGKVQSELDVNKLPSPRKNEGEGIKTEKITK